ncbi:MAG: hypothetical protein IJH48_06010 [Oscillospiraceae bacterium]|nr:hypothetical protein [Oscillospiraceae bacterium]
MKSDIIRIDNQGYGYEDVVKEVERAAQYRGLSHKEELQLRLCAEEMLSLVRSVTGEMKACFWLANEGRDFDLHLSTNTVMDKEKRDLLIQSTTSRRNEAARTFLGKLRDLFEEAMATYPDVSENDIPDEVYKDLLVHPETSPEWDEYEKSVLRSVADGVKIAIRSGKVDMTVSKSFG